MGDPVYSHSPVPSVASLDDSTQPGFTLSDISSLKSASSGSEQSLDKIGTLPLNINDTDKKLKHVGFLLDEMKDTELTYINALTDVTEGYIARLRVDVTSGFTVDIIKEAFVNIEVIHLFHEKFHTDLINCDNSHKLVAQLFLNKIDILTLMYVEFCSAFPRSLEKLEELHSTEPSKSALAQCQRELGHIFAVEEYLHRAVQRFLKYPLLFKDMAKKLVDLDGYEIVKKALDKLLVTAVKINAVKRVQELQANELVGRKGDNLTLMGDLLLEDSFKLVGAKDRRYLFLFKQSLLLTKKRESDGTFKNHKADGTFAYKNEIAMDNITLKEQVDNDFLKWTIIVGKGSEMFTFQARDDEQKDRWTREIKRCIVYSMPGLTEEQKESLLLKLPSLKNDYEHIDRIWKRASKKTKKAKRSESVRILHNPERDDMDNTSEISQAFDSPTLSSPSLYSNNGNKENSASLNNGNIETPDEDRFNRRTAIKKRPAFDELSSDIELNENTDKISDSDGDKMDDEDDALVSDLDMDHEITYKSDVTAYTDKAIDSDIENVKSVSEEVVLDTGADSLLGLLSHFILKSQYYPVTLLLLVYFVACLFYYVPWYFMYPSTAVLVFLGYRSTQHTLIDKQKKSH